MAKKKEQKQTDIPPKNNKAEVQKWLSDEQKSEHYRDKIAGIFRWKDFIEEYKGRFEIVKQNVDIQINALNFVFAYIKTEIPALSLRDPYIKVNPKRESSIDSAKVLETVINYLWRNKKFKREIKKCIMDGKLIGHAWFKTGYTGKTGVVEMDNGQTIETIEAEDFFGYRIPWDCITFSNGAIDPPYDCAWICHTVYAPLDDIKKNPNYKNTERMQAQSRKVDNYSSTTYSSMTEDTNQEMGCIKEFWDVKNKKVFTLSPGVDDYLEAPKDWTYEMRGFPFSYLNFNPVNDEPYGLPDVYMFESQIIELMKLRAAQLDHIKRFNRQFLTTEQNFSQEAKDQLAMGITGSVVECQDITKIAPLPYPPFQQDAYAIEERLKEDMINISGQSPQERGATQKTTTRTFRELAQIQKGAENRRAEQIDMVEQFIEDIASNMIALLQQFADVPYYVRVTGQTPEEVMQAIQKRPSAQQQGMGAVTNQSGFTFTKEDIKGEFDLEIVAGSTAPLDKANTLDTILQIMQLMPQMGVMPGGPLYGAIGNIMAEQLGIEEIKEAIKQEAVFMDQQKQKLAQQQDDMQNMEVAKQSAKTQIDSEKVATKQSQVLLDAMKVFKPQDNSISNAK